MDRNAIIKYAALHAVCAFAYIVLVATFMSNAEALLGQGGDGDVLNIVVFLHVFVISAAVMGLLIFGRPAMWYLNGGKKEAVMLALATIGFLVLIAAVIGLALALRRG
jgi:hypothetical protein